MISHHIGCLFSHMRMWRLHQKFKSKWTIIFESDGGWYLKVDAGSLQSVVDNAPDNADVIFLKTKDESTGQFIKQWPVGDDDMVYMYAVNRLKGGAGLSGYMIGPKFTEKIYDQITLHRGADMVDAWLLIQMCSHRDERYATYKPRINCYHVQSGAKPPRAVGGYLPEWYGSDRSARTTDNWSEWLKNERSEELYAKSRAQRMEDYTNGLEDPSFAPAARAHRIAERRRRLAAGIQNTTHIDTDNDTTDAADMASF